MEKSQQTSYLILIFLTVVDILILAYVLFYPVDASEKYVVGAFDFVVCLILWIEFIYSYRHSDDKKLYIKDNAISVLGMLPFDFIFLRALRLIKLVQLIKKFIILRNSERIITQFLKKTFLDKIILVGILFVFTITVLIRVFDSDINDIQTAFWYIIVSMTSTGYGDVVPQTVSGRLVGMIAMIGGILIFATVTAVISSIYMSKLNQDNQDNLESKIDELTMEIEKLNKKIDELKK